MQSESARMSSAAEARFRVESPNSKPRAVKVIALDAASERVVKRTGAGVLAARELPHRFGVLLAPLEGERFSMGGWLNDLAGRTRI